MTPDFNSNVKELLMDNNLSERVAVVESHMLLLSQNQAKMLHTLDEIKVEMTRYKGFIGGCAFLISCMWAALVLLKDSILNR